MDPLVNLIKFLHFLPGLFPEAPNWFFLIVMTDYKVASILPYFLAFNFCVISSWV